MTVYFATNSTMYQDRVLNRIVFKYLYDNEYSVRRAASKCLLRYGLNCLLNLYQVLLYLFLFIFYYNLHIFFMFVLVLFIIVITKLIICNKTSLPRGFAQIQIYIVLICFSSKIVCKKFIRDYNINLIFFNVFNFIFR